MSTSRPSDHRSQPTRGRRPRNQRLDRSYFEAERIAGDDDAIHRQLVETLSLYSRPFYDTACLDSNVKGWASPDIFYRKPQMLPTKRELVACHDPVSLQRKRK
jgi:hypothetical protein